MPQDLHALIIEDEMITGVGMQFMLSDLGFASFAFAGTQAQAMEQALLRRPDLVTVDVGLLDGDGLSAVRAIRRVIGRLPTLYVTGDPRAVREAREQEDGEMVVVEKPFMPSDLASAYARLKAQPDFRGALL